MIAVVFSGSRYADWKLAEDGEVISDSRTVGINPFFNDEKFITAVLNRNNTLITHAERIKRIYFFGPGASSAEKRKTVESAFSKFFRFSKITVDHDIKAVALATCGDNPGIVAMLSSGSNAAYYTGKKIKENNYGLGFILGDEGSSNWMGRKLLKNFLNGTLPADFENKFSQRYHLDQKSILEKVYRLPQPAMFLSSFVDFLLEQKEDQYVRNLVLTGFNEFFQKYIIPLKEKHPDVTLNFGGSVSAGFDEYLKLAASKHGLEIETIIKDPIQNVLNYFTNKNQ